MILLDTDFLFSYFDSAQSTHLKSLEVMQRIAEYDFCVSNLVKQELATVISYKLGYAECQKVVESVTLLDVTEVFINQQDTENVWKVFFSQLKKGISFVDCSNLYLAKENNYKIASFDKFYPKSFLVS